MTTRKTIEKDKEVFEILWSSATMKGIIQNGKKTVITKTGEVIEVDGVDMDKINALRIYSDLHFKLLRKVMPDAMPDKEEEKDTNMSEVLSKLVDKLPR